MTVNVTAALFVAVRGNLPRPSLPGSYPRTGCESVTDLPRQLGRTAELLIASIDEDGTVLPKAPSSSVPKWTHN
jgi:hypothetical protein